MHSTPCTICDLRVKLKLHKIVFCTQIWICSALLAGLQRNLHWSVQEWIEVEEPATSLALLAPLRFHAYWWSFGLATFAGTSWLTSTLYPVECSVVPWMVCMAA